MNLIMCKHDIVTLTSTCFLQVDAELPGIMYNMKFETFKSPRQLLIKVLLINSYVGDLKV